MTRGSIAVLGALAATITGCGPSKPAPPTTLPTTGDLLTEGLADISDHASMEFGDATFLRGDHDSAREHYRRVTARPGSPYRTLANYKLGWLLYRRDSFVAAIGFFETAFVQSAGPDEATLRAEAVQYIAISLTEPWAAGETPGPADAIRRGVERYGSDRSALSARVFEALGDVLRDRDAAAEAKQSYELALSITPKDSPLRSGLRLKISNLATP